MYGIDLHYRHLISRGDYTLNGSYPKGLLLDACKLTVVGLSIMLLNSCFMSVDAYAFQEVSREKQVVTSTIADRLERGEAVFLESNPQPYRLSSTLIFGRGATLRGPVGTVVIFSNDTPAFDVPVGSNDVLIENIVFQQNGRSRILGAVRAENFRFIGGGAKHAGALIFSGALKGRVQSSQFHDGVAANAIAITKNSSAIVVDGNEFQRNAGFGVQIDNNANGNQVSNNWTRSNGIELIGIRYNAFSNVIAYNRVEGTGDNGISVTGYRNIVIGNYVAGNALNGIAVYGDENTVIGNVSISNGQNLNPESHLYNKGDQSIYAGILANGAFGGGGHNNVIIGNIINDEQSPRTQLECVLVGRGYGHWKPGAKYFARRFIYSGGSIYQAESSGISGATMPSGMGSVSDGNIKWTYIKTPSNGYRMPSGNIVAENQSIGCPRTPIIEGLQK